MRLRHHMKLVRGGERHCCGGLSTRPLARSSTYLATARYWTHFSNLVSLYVIYSLVDPILMASDTPEFPSKCPTCPGLLNRNAFLESLEGSEDCQTTIRALQSANDCPNGGCNLILDAITKFCPRLSPDQYVVSCGQGTVVLEVSNDTDSSSSTRLQLFFTKGTLEA